MELNRPFLWIAFDGLAEREVETLALAHELMRVPGNTGVKVNLDAALKYGFAPLRKMFADVPLFVDLKMMNGARTMTSVLLEAHRAGFTAVSAHALGGGHSTKNGGDPRQAIADFREREPGSPLRIYAVTIMTHYSDDYCAAHFGCSMVDLVRRLAVEGINAGADAIIMPGTFLNQVSGLRSTWVIPGIRPKNYRDTRHKQAVLPEMLKGRKDVEGVCGSPIVYADDPPQALVSILSALAA